MEALISIIVPVYNGQAYLKNCIESIELQTYRRLEVIIVNDGSTDGTGKVCKELSQKYDNIQVITMNDEGVSAARNAGIRKAVGEYLMFVDADDRLHSEAVQTLYDALVHTDSDMSSCGFFTWCEEAEWQKKAQLNEGQTEKTEVLIREEFLKKGIMGNDTRCWGKLYKKSLLTDQGFREGLTIGEDMLFLVDILPAMNRMVSVSFQGYGYYQNPKGAMNRKFSPGYMDQITCWEIAREKALQIDRNLEARATTILLMAIMLTVGKLAFLSAKERKQQSKYITVCRQKLIKELQVEGAYEGLSVGYKIKTRFFEKSPDLYLKLYHLHKFLG